MEDWNSIALSEALALRHKLPSLLPLPSAYDWQRRVSTITLHATRFVPQQKIAPYFRT